MVEDNSKCPTGQKLPLQMRHLLKDNILRFKGENESLQAFARRIGVQNSTIYRLQALKWSPKAYGLIYFAEKLNTSIDSLLHNPYTEEVS